MRHRTVAAALAVAVVGAGVLAGCGSSVSPAAAVRSWAAAAGPFGESVQTLERDASRVHDAIRAGRSAPEIRTDCAELYQDANGENTDLLPTPDPQLTAHLSAAYDGFVRASAMCVSSPGTERVLVVVDRALARSIGDLYAAILREGVVTGHRLVPPGSA